MKISNPKRIGKYRYYTKDDIFIINKIHDFQQLGFSLKDIKKLIPKDINNTKLISFLSYRLDSCNKEIENLQKQKKKIADFYHSIIIESKSSDKLKCFFCGKDKKDVKYLIAGPNDLICDQCLIKCNEIVTTHRRKTNENG